MPKRAPDPLARGVELFNAARYDEAEAIFAAAVNEPRAAFFLEQTRLARLNDPAGFDADARKFRAAARAGNAARMAAAAKTLTARGPARAFRTFRDLWLSGAGKTNAGLSPWALFLRSSRSWRDGKNEAALRELARAARTPEFSWMLYQSAEILLRRLDRADDAVKVLAQARAGSPWLWEAACLDAEIRAGRGDTSALERLDARTAPSGSESAFYAWRGALHLWTQGGSTARADLEKGADTLDGLGWRGAAKAHAGDWTGAVADLDRRLAAEPDAEAFCWRGEAKERLGKRAEALRDYASALAMADGWFWARVGRALLTLESGGSPAEDWRALTGPASAAVAPARMADALRSARTAARGLRRPDTHLQGFWLDGAASPADWLARRSL